MAEIGLIDTTLRDGQQSIWAYRMRASAMLPVAPLLDAARFDAVEFVLATAQFTRAIVELHENPWDWVELGADRFVNSAIRMHGGMDRRFRDIPAALQELLISRLVRLGIKTTRLSDPWNDFESLKRSRSTLAALGMSSVVNLIFSVSPRHSIEYYLDRVDKAVQSGVTQLCFKDVGGLLTPEIAVRLFPAIREAASGVMLEFHGHDSNGFGLYNSLLAADFGFERIHTAIPPLAGGASLPSVFEVHENLEARGHQVRVSLDPLYSVAEHLERVAEVDRLPVSHGSSFRASSFSHQVPGGMISNLEFQLKGLGLAHRLDEVLAEISVVRRDLGYPIMVTPLSQFVGAQAVSNVVTGERYSRISEQVAAYARGEWGAEAISVMDPLVRSTILERSKNFTSDRQRSDTGAEALDEIRLRHPGISDDDLIALYYAGATPPDRRTVEEVLADSARYGAGLNGTLSYIHARIARSKDTSNLCIDLRS